MSLTTQSPRPAVVDDDLRPPEPLEHHLRHRVRAAAWWLTTGLAALLVLLALVVPNELERLTPGNLARLPLEGLVAVGLVLALPPRARLWFAGSFGALLGVVTIQKAFDVGFNAVLARPFDPVLDVALLGPGVDYLTSSLGRTRGLGVVAVLVAAAVAVVAGLTLATLRLARATVRYRRPATLGAAAAGVVWALCAGLGAQYVPGRPVASYDAAAIAWDRVAQAGADLRDREAFAREAAVDRFRATPGDRLLTGLRGKDVVVAFVESYGRSAIEDPALAAEIGTALDDGNRRLRGAGFASRSGWLTSSTVGGSSWLAHASLLSGLWVDTEQRYRTLVASDRLTLNGAFERAGWRTAGVMPGIRRAWPEGESFYGYDRLYGAHDLGYEGPRFGYSTMPDQFTLAALQRLERAPGHAPVMVETALLSSHAPWAPLPAAVGWDDVGDGSVFDPMVGPGDRRRAMWRDAAPARAAYARSVRYSLTTLVSYLERYGDDDLVLVFLGDHEPAPLVTGSDAGHDVPITVVARDPRVLDRIAGWGWTDGLRPAPEAPVWPMDEFRDRFLTAFGSTPS